MKWEVLQFILMGCILRTALNLGHHAGSTGRALGAGGHQFESGRPDSGWTSGESWRRTDRTPISLLKHQLTWLWQAASTATGRDDVRLPAAW